jgi:hypothetical protein
MFKILLALHLLTAIFAVGPLVGAATTATRGLRSGDAGATDGAARTLTVYSYASVLVVVLGFGLMSADNPYGPGKVAEFSETWIWLSVLLWVVSMAVLLPITIGGLGVRESSYSVLVKHAGGNIAEGASTGFALALLQTLACAVILGAVEVAERMGYAPRAAIEAQAAEARG